MISLTDLNNAQTDVNHISTIATSPALTATDRLGHTKDTVAGALYKIGGINNRGAWVGPGTAYASKDIAQQSGNWYICTVAHTSSASFATDSPLYWRVYQGVTSGDLGATTGAGLVGWIRNAVSAVAATIADWIGWRAASPLDFMSAAMRTDVTSGTLSMDHTAAVQAAINTGKTVDLLGYYYKVNNLSQSTNSQAIISSQGIARLIKNANGPILTSTADDFVMKDINWRGDAATPTFTGDGVVATGQRPDFNNCGGRWITGRALKATGGRVFIKGTCDIYQTTDASATGYDIEIGVSGTATLYHQIKGVYTSQATGGILLTDTGAAVISGGQIGKLTHASGTSPSGVNGGMTDDVRILGNVTIGLSNAVIDNCQLDAVAVVFQAGTSNCRYGLNNVMANGGTITNNGNKNNRIEREVSTGSVMQKKYGDDSSVAVFTTDPGTGDRTLPGNAILQNNKSFQIKDSTGTSQVAALLSASNNWQFGSNVSTGSATLAGGTGGAYLSVNATSIVQAWSGGFRPQTDNTLNSGTASQRWNTIYAGTGTINTSDGREKQQIRTLNDAERATALACKGLLRAFKFNDAVGEKGSAARIHFGAIAQDVADAFRSEGLDPHDYALFCYDEWPSEDAVLEHREAVAAVVDDEGKIIVPGEPATTVVIRAAIAAGNRYGVRYDELLAFMLASI